VPAAAGPPLQARRRYHATALPEPARTAQKAANSSKSVLPEGVGAWFGKRLDPHMMAAMGGLERTEAEDRQLFAAHGFRLTRLVPTASDISLIEGQPV
jgi:hypothetical protein